MFHNLDKISMDQIRFGPVKCIFYGRIERNYLHL